MSIRWSVRSERRSRDRGRGLTITWFGSSFIANTLGKKIVEADRTSETAIVAKMNLDINRTIRAAFGFFRDRRPEMYGTLMTMTG